jgi:aromatic-L-amino-acid/L-tryptophan decarboxylase
MEDAPPQPSPGIPLDMSAEDFAHHFTAVTEWITRYLAQAELYPVLSRCHPGEVASGLPDEAPDEPQDFESILDSFRRVILPGITHWNHPAFFAYFGITGAAVGVMAEALAAALNVNAMLWRTSPAATELEELSLQWLRQMFGLPDAFRGHLQDTASTSTMVALAGARHARDPDSRRLGLAGRQLAPLRLYCSAEAHSSVDRAALTLGIGTDNVRRIETDHRFRMKVDALDVAVQEDLDAGATPLCVVATIGTTSTTSVDPVAEVAALCRRYDLWLHVDAAYAGAAAVLPEMRHLMNGWGEADSIVVNPHKWMFVPIDCSALFLRDPATVSRAFSVVPEYLRTPEGGAATNLMDYGPALGRRFRSLKLWMTLAYFGREGYQDRLRRHVQLARDFAGWLGAEAGWHLMAPVPFSTVCFRYSPEGMDPSAADRLNERILEKVNATGEAFLSATRLNGRYVLRLAIGNVRTESRHVERAWHLLRSVARDES